MCVYAAVKHFVEFKINKETNVHQRMFTKHSKAKIKCQAKERELGGKRRKIEDLIEYTKRREREREEEKRERGGRIESYYVIIYIIYS